ncbi:malonate decarboxylase holo-ACP synthase [Paenibacillus sp. J2TS4]|uniref:malonate decarboxylase holo-ACP synthase n=1 Tax=Paenibacillus sp. J2TS4 TaxID=2807194 RepID=UPI001B05DAD9|nr:malonate decarboxylase holo-ACP synthase [Paenibacillus sp. J2TS4]GIP31676.1 malonate decarboxylase holo-ACP synthase [Paenibacillus sp. J2TS4]
MELMPHDLIKIKNTDGIIHDAPPPNWVKGALECFPYAVVRRAPLLENRIPVGIRGDKRCYRQPAAINFDNILQRVTPEELADKKMWRSSQRLRDFGVADTLDQVDKILTEQRLKWGPTGSVGFELASGAHAVNENSDLDIVIRAVQFLPVSTAMRIMLELEHLSLKADIQMETTKGAVALAEYARGGDVRIILRTVYGPVLVNSPWYE